MKRDEKPFDFVFFILVMSLLSIGLIMVFSASSESARFYHNDVYFFIKKQLFWAGLSLAAMFFMANFHYKRLEKLAFIGFLGSLALLGLVLIPGIGMEVNGSMRWLDFKIIGFQPSEVMKLALILFFAKSLAINQKKLKSFRSGLLPYLMVLGVIAVLLMLEPHMSGTVVIMGVGMIMLFLSGAEITHLVVLGIAALSGGVGLIFAEPYRLRRLLSAWDPFQDKLGDGWQAVQSLYAIGSGGLFGFGLGRSRQKFLYIPEPHNDFIFAILCEEMGFVGAFFVILLFIMLIYRGIKIAMSAPDVFSCLVASGIITLIAIEVVINIAVVTAVMPVTGMPLPFFSYGGTTLLINMIAMGIMLNISRYAKKN